ncbi:hypothetical protein H9P43_005338 [Blastocladiella emersonii ATCC 22665]|nr:hypothetical protein H9P43_005338 [Blastocladiella emersonii ATCC 22665]
MQVNRHTFYSPPTVDRPTTLARGEGEMLAPGGTTASNTQPRAGGGGSIAHDTLSVGGSAARVHPHAGGDGASSSYTSSTVFATAGSLAEHKLKDLSIEEVPEQPDQDPEAPPSTRPASPRKSYAPAQHHRPAAATTASTVPRASGPPAKQLPGVITGESSTVPRSAVAVPLSPGRAVAGTRTTSAPVNTVSSPTNASSDPSSSSFSSTGLGPRPPVKRLSVAASSSASGSLFSSLMRSRSLRRERERDRGRGRERDHGGDEQEDGSTTPAAATAHPVVVKADPPPTFEEIVVHARAVPAHVPRPAGRYAMSRTAANRMLQVFLDHGVMDIAGLARLSSSSYGELKRRVEAVFSPGARVAAGGGDDGEAVVGGLLDHYARVVEAAGRTLEVVQLVAAAGMEPLLGLAIVGSEDEDQCERHYALVAVVGFLVLQRCKKYAAAPQPPAANTTSGSGSGSWSRGKRAGSGPRT